MAVSKNASNTLASILLLAASSAFATPAPQFSYNFVEAGYVDYDGDFSGFGGRGSFSVSPNLSVIGGYDSTTEDETGLDIEFSMLSIGASYQFPINAYTGGTTDLSLHVEYEKYKAEVVIFGETVSADESGFRLGAQMRHLMSSSLELNGDVSLDTAGDTDFILSLGGIYSVTPNLGVAASYSAGDADRLFIGGRFYF